MDWWLVAGLAGCVLVGVILDAEVDNHPQALEDRPILRKFVYAAAVPLIYAALLAAAFPFVILWEAVFATPVAWLNSVLMWPVKAAGGVMPESVTSLLDWALTGLGILIFGWISYLGVRLLWQMYGPGPNPWEPKYPPERDRPQ